MTADAERVEMQNMPLLNVYDIMHLNFIMDCTALVRSG
jgi:hypothetical protein